MDHLNLHHLRSVVTLAEELNFGRAAARLHMSQPPLSRLVNDVERAVGSRLFERTTRRVTLTPVGEVFVAEARASTARAEQALDSLRAAVRRQAGKVSIGYTWSAFNTVIPQVISRLREHDHDVSVDLVELSTEAQREALGNGRVDFGFVDQPLELEGFESLRLIERPVHVLVRFDALAGETLILHARHEYPRYYDQLLAACREAGFTPHVYHREARQNCLALVTTGQGLLLTPALSYPRLPGGLRCLPLEGAPAQRRTEVWAVVPVAPRPHPLLLLREIIRAGDVSRAPTASLPAAGQDCRSAPPTYREAAGGRKSRIFNW